MTSYAEINGCRIAYRLSGPEGAPPVTMCHSLLTDSSMWDEQMPALRDYRVLRIDMRGHGASSATTPPYTLQLLADDVAGLLDHLKLPRTHYIGLSIGGMIGQALAIKHAGKLRSLMLCDTRARALADQAPIWAERIGQAQTAGSVAPLIDSTLQRWFTPAFMQSHKARVDQVRATLQRCSLEGFIGCGTAISSFDFTPQLAGITLPSLVLCGDRDPSTTPEENKYLAAHIKGARLEEIPGLHLPNNESADRFNAIMTTWLKHEGERRCPARWRESKSST
jgi:3-oxoadipate enol-lactonase